METNTSNLSAVHIKSKLPSVGNTIFSVMSALAKEEDAINLSQGFPDFSCSETLVKRVNHYMKKGFNQYAPMPGILSLREKIATDKERLYSSKLNPETDITITAGATQAIYTAIAATINEGDEVIIFDPAYDCYVPAVELHRGVPVHIELDSETYGLNWDQLKTRINQKTKMIILNTPHNPTGSILKESDLVELEKILDGKDIIILSDEVYEHIIFDEQKHQSILAYPNLFEKSFVISSFGKTYHNTGWKMGYCIAPEYLMKEFRKVHQYLVFSVNTPLQMAFADELDNTEHYAEVASMYSEKRNFFRSALESSNFELKDCAGTYFQLLDYSKISDEADTEMAIRLTKEIGVASIPTSVFYKHKTDHKVLRFCFAKSEKILEKAAKKLSSL